MRNALKEMQGDYKDLKMEVVVEEGNLGNYLKEKGDNYDWIIMNRNGYRG